MANIHPTAVIEDGAEIGEGAEIGPHVTIYRHVTLGPNCRIHAGAVLGDIPQDLAFNNVESHVRIGANCVIREHATIHRGTKPDTSTIVGDGCYLMTNSHLAHNVRLGSRVIVASGALLAGYVEVGDLAFISGNSVVHQFVRIGKLAMLSGLSGIGKDIPPFCTTRGAEPNQVGGLNVVGMRRAGMGPAQRTEVKRAFKLLYRSGLNVTQALEAIRGEFRTGPALEMCDFIEASVRGICRMAETDDEESY
jgi:UDP-N-acetylglucosamine acyltransferase